MFFSILNINSLLAAALLLSKDEDIGVAAIPLILCLSGFIYFGFMYARYRNSDKRHHHESETHALMQNLQQYDQFNSHRKRLKNASMKGSNDTQIEGALNNRDGFAEQLTDVAKSLVK